MVLSHKKITFMIRLKFALLLVAFMLEVIVLFLKKILLFYIVFIPALGFIHPLHYCYHLSIYQTIHLFSLMPSIFCNCPSSFKPSFFLVSLFPSLPDSHFHSHAARLRSLSILLWGGCVITSSIHATRTSINRQT